MKQEIISLKQNEACTTVNYIEHFLILDFVIIRCISVSDFTVFLSITIGITSSAIGLKICAIIAGIKIYKSIIKKNKHDKIVLLAKSRLNSIEVLISKALIESNISHDKFVLINNGPKEYDEMKEELNNSNT